MNCPNTTGGTLACETSVPQPVEGWALPPSDRPVLTRATTESLNHPTQRYRPFFHVHGTGPSRCQADLHVHQAQRVRLPPRDGGERLPRRRPVGATPTTEASDDGRHLQRQCMVCATHFHTLPRTPVLRRRLRRTHMLVRLETSGLNFPILCAAWLPLTEQARTTGATDTLNLWAQFLAM